MSEKKKAVDKISSEYIKTVCEVFPDFEQRYDLHNYLNSKQGKSARVWLLKTVGAKKRCMSENLEVSDIEKAFYDKFGDIGSELIASIKDDAKSSNMSYEPYLRQVAKDMDIDNTPNFPELDEVKSVEQVLGFHRKYIKGFQLTLENLVRHDRHDIIDNIRGTDGTSFWCKFYNEVGNDPEIIENSSGQSSKWIAKTSHPERLAMIYRCTPAEMQNVQEETKAKARDFVGFILDGTKVDDNILNLSDEHPKEIMALAILKQSGQNVAIHSNEDFLAKINLPEVKDTAVLINEYYLNESLGMAVRFVDENVKNGEYRTLDLVSDTQKNIEVAQRMAVAKSKLVLKSNPSARKAEPRKKPILLTPIAVVKKNNNKSNSV